MLLAIVFGLYGLVIGCILLLIHLCSIEVSGRPYLYPISPFDKVYFFKTLLKGFNKQEQLLLPIGITEENNIKTILFLFNKSKYFDILKIIESSEKNEKW